MGPPSVELSNRLSDVSEYYFSRKLKEVALLKERGTDVISLAVGSPDIPPHPSVVKALTASAARTDTHGYQPYVGAPVLRRAFARFYSETYGVALDPSSQVLPLIGSKEGILHITMAFCNQGDAVLVPDPGYLTYSSVAKLLEVTPLRYGLLEDDGWAPDFDQMASLVEGCGRRVRILWANYPHMPTGAPATEGVFKRLLSFAERHGLILVNDNPYSLTLPRDAPLSILRYPTSAGRLELNSLSKSHCMPGWRVGVVVSPDPRLIKAVLRVKSNFDSGMFLGVQEAAAAALTEVPPSFFKGVNAEYAARSDTGRLLLSELGCTVQPGQVGLFLWAKAPSTWPSVESVLDELLAVKGVFLVPGSVFGPRGSRFVRLSLCCPLPRLREALERVQTFKITLPNARL